MSQCNTVARPVRRRVKAWFAVWCVAGLSVVLTGCPAGQPDSADSVDSAGAEEMTRVTLTASTYGNGAKGGADDGPVVRFTVPKACGTDWEAFVIGDGDQECTWSAADPEVSFRVFDSYASEGPGTGEGDAVATYGQGHAEYLDYEMPGSGRAFTYILVPDDSASWSLHIVADSGGGPYNICFAFDVTLASQATLDEIKSQAQGFIAALDPGWANNAE